MPREAPHGRESEIGNGALLGRRNGEGGIRTHGTVARTPVFETGPFDHSGTSPAGELYEVRRRKDCRRSGPTGSLDVQKRSVGGGRNSANAVGLPPSVCNAGWASRPPRRRRRRRSTSRRRR